MKSHMRKLKQGLFKVEDESDQKENEDFEINKPDVTYNEHGFDQAKNHSGGSTALKIELHKIYNGYKEELRQNKIEQEELKKPYRIKLQGLRSENQELVEKNQEIEDETKPNLKEKIEKIKDEIRYIKENPETVVGDKVSKASFYIGSIIILFLTLYLMVFYSSASYSAFFKEFNVNTLGVAESIFDPQAFSKALQDGITELVLIAAMPFVFLGLGYLIHKFQEQRGIGKYFKIALLLLVTFIFDTILAYEITHKIYELKASNSFEAMPPYTIADAFYEVNFWLIIFAGFVVYIIWGFVFDFVMEAYEKLDKVGLAVRNKKEKIQNCEDREEILDKKIFKNKEKISENKTQIDKLEEILGSYVIQPKKFEKIYSEFMSGWVHCLNALKLGEQKVKEAQEIGENFVSNVLSDYQIEDKSYETT